MPTIAILGGTGAEGFGLALRWARAGESVIIGSRDAGRAREAAAKIQQRLTATRQFRVKTTLPPAPPLICWSSQSRLRAIVPC